jgi:prepilin-type N-terminal cleavage/methylation domain-containing protein
MPEPLTARGALDNGVEIDMKMRNEAGFSLLEMIVAVAVTLVITGAVYGLIAGGNNAFRREPELTERQQNVRMAMDLIIRDISTTGSSLPAFIQAFSPGLDACSASNTSPAGTTKNNRCPVGGATGTTAFNTGIQDGSAATLPDDLEMIGNPGNFDGEATCHYPGGSSSHVNMVSGGTNVPAPSVILVIMADGSYTVVNANTANNSSNTQAGNCDKTSKHMQIEFNSGNNDPTGLNQPGGLCTGKGVGTTSNTTNCTPIMVAQGEVIRYGIRRDAEGIPNLYRFSTGGILSGVVNWQLVAKGVEDMQVQYRHLDPVTLQPASNWLNEPPLVAGCDPTNPAANCCDPGCVPPSCMQPAGCTQPTNAGLARLVTEVRVTLTSRSEARNIQGATQSVAGGDRIRGSLTQTITPRATLFALSRRPQAAGGAAWR